ncbi:MAG: DUF3748 domain-containing protein [Chitinophagaceae bacterium]|nr:DUF3748 domain-containing protein [Chitinophagaceae bacterium]
MKFEEIQITHDPNGHCLNSTQCFSPDDQWIVYDGRNDDAQIGSSAIIAMVNTSTGEIRELYKTTDQTEYGPGVGAATFSPTRNRVLFIHGIRNASAQNPYSITRRTGVAVDIESPGLPIFMDARNVSQPFTNGALRGGTHAHTWSGDGEWISFTYNDYVVEQAAKTDNSIRDLRTIGIMIPGRKVFVPENGMENNNGNMFSLVVATVKENPLPGSEEIEKAFDETWIGKNGYRKSDGTWQNKAIAYQGNLRDENGQLKTEIFVVDIPDNILIDTGSMQWKTTSDQRLSPPPGLIYRRITYTTKGLTDKPRHWLRSDDAGERIAFLAEDEKRVIQLFTISPNGGNPEQLTDSEFSIQGPFNFSPDGQRIAYIADNSVFITEVNSLKTVRITERFNDASKPVGAVNWSNSGTMLCYNRYIECGSGKFLQIILLKTQ